MRVKIGIAAVLSLAAAAGAWAQEAQLGWSSISAPAGSAAAWTTRAAATSAARPQVLILMRTVKQGTAPGTDIRSSQVITMDVDCPSGMVHPASMDSYGADFNQTSVQLLQTQWAPFAAIGELGAVAQFYCANPNHTIEWQADIKGAQQKLDAQLPKP